MPDSASHSMPPPEGPAIDRLLTIMARLRAPDGCPWDREQDHRSLRFHAIEEVYELLDAIEAEDDLEMAEELGDLLLQVVFHAQLARERGAFDFEKIAARLVEKLIYRHPHVFGDAEARTAAAVWEQWDRLKRAEKAGTAAERHSALDGIPRHLPALMQAQKLWKKARRAGLASDAQTPDSSGAPFPENPEEMGALLFALAARCQERGWSAEELLRQASDGREAAWRARESEEAAANKSAD